MGNRPDVGREKDGSALRVQDVRVSVGG
jgi:hypothetical protein